MKILTTVIAVFGLVFFLMAGDSNGMNKQESHSLELNIQKAGDELKESEYDQIIGQQIILPCELAYNGNQIEIVATVDGVTRTFMGKKI